MGREQQSIGIQRRERIIVAGITLIALYWRQTPAMTHTRHPMNAVLDSHRWDTQGPILIIVPGGKDLHR